MFKCEECGAVFEDLAVWKEDRGECFGFPSSERMCGCPECHSVDFKEYDPDEDEESEAEDDDDFDEYEFDPRDADCESQ